MTFKKTKNQIIILNLLDKYENRFQLNNQKDWRLDQYLKAIFQMIEEEEQKNNGKLNDELVAAKKKAEFFKNLLDAQSKETLLDQYSAINKLSSNQVESQVSPNVSPQTKAIHLSKIANCEKEIRRELFQGNNREKKLNSEKNYADVIKYHKLLQDQMTNEMVTLARSLKHNASVSNEIVKKDTELLERTNKFAETTYANLKVNTNRISEFANMACEYWLWISLFMVMLTFLFMVIFIRLFPKKVQTIVHQTLGNEHTEL